MWRQGGDLANFRDVESFDNRLKSILKLVNTDTVVWLCDPTRHGNVTVPGVWYTVLLANIQPNLAKVTLSAVSIPAKHANSASLAKSQRDARSS